MTGQDVVLDLLRYVGVTGFLDVDNDQRLNHPGLDSDDIRRAIAAINSALKSVQEFGPQDVKYAERAAFYNDPLTLEITVLAEQGKSALATTTPPQWMLGCSVLIEGDTDLNRILDITGDEFSLIRGYRGTNLAGLTATVFADCALLDEDIAAVLEPVTISPNLKLFPARDLDEFLRIQRRWWFMGYQRPYEGLGYAIYETPNPRPGVPGLFYVERRRNGEVFLRLAPMPAQRANATFQAKLRSEYVTDSIVNTETGEDPGYEFTSLHAEEVESILLPIARWRFFSHPALKNAEVAPRIKAEYDESMLRLRHGVTMEVVTKDNRVVYI